MLLVLCRWLLLQAARRARGRARWNARGAKYVTRLCSESSRKFLSCHPSDITFFVILSLTGWLILPWVGAYAGDRQEQEERQHLREMEVCICRLFF
jgi:hypothetical protein